MSDKLELEAEPHLPQNKPHTDFEENFLWAVSYSDLLMVLLCFFILFFSFDKSDKESIIEIIASNVDKTHLGGGKSAASAETKPGAIPITGVLTSLKDLNIQYSAETKQLSIHFSDNVFDKGKYTLNNVGEKELNNVLQALHPYKEHLKISIIGHTDNTPIGASRQNFLNNNFDLSSLRARHILEKSIATGFAEKNISLQAAAEHVRNSRTISIKVTEIGIAP